MNDFEFGTDCEAMRAGIVALIDGEAGEAESDAIRSHLSGCSECADFHDDAIALLQMTRKALPPTALAGLEFAEIDTPDVPTQPAESALLLAELQAARAEMRILRAEMAEMRTLLAAVSRQGASVPLRPVARPVFPSAAPMDRLRTDR